MKTGGYTLNYTRKWVGCTWIYWLFFNIVVTKCFLDEKQRSLSNQMQNSRIQSEVKYSQGDWIEYRNSVEIKSQKSFTNAYPALSDMNNSSKELAVLSVRSLLTLSGGALIAIPSYIEIFEPSLSAAASSGMFNSVSDFVYCIIFILLAIFLGFYSYSFSGKAVGSVILFKSHEIEAEERLNTLRDTFGYEYGKSEARKIFRKYRLQSFLGTFFEILAILLFVIGLSYFVSGAYNATGILFLGEKHVYKPAYEIFYNFLVEFISLNTTKFFLKLAFTIFLLYFSFFLIRKGIMGRSGQGNSDQLSNSQIEGTDTPDSSHDLKNSNDTKVVNQNPLVEKYKDEIYNEQLEEVHLQTGEDKEKILMDAYVSSQIVFWFEKNYRIIFGSQIKLLRWLSNRDKKSETIKKLKPFYEVARIEFPNIYKEYSYDQWLGFLKNQLFVEEKDGSIHLTLEGDQFIHYLEGEDYSFDRIG